MYATSVELREVRARALGLLMFKSFPKRRLNMKHESWIQVISLIVLVILALFYDPTKANLWGKILFGAVTLALVLFLIFFDLYNKVEELETKIKIFNEKLQIHERLSNLEEFRKKEEKKSDK